MPNISIKFIPLFLFSFFFLLLFPSSTSAQVFTKQRTTGTYLPANAASVRQDTTIDPSAPAEFALPDGSVKIVLPANFYAGKIKFSAAKISWENNNAIPSLKISGESFLGNEVFEITATDHQTNLPVLKFDKNITIHFRYYDPDATNIDEQKLKIRFFDRLKQEWTLMDTTIDTESNTITLQTDHLTLFAITKPDTSTPAVNPIIPGTTSEPGSVPLWQIIIAIIIILIILSVGGWYLYKIYQDAKNDQMLSSENPIFGDITPSNPTPTDTSLPQEENTPPTPPPPTTPAKKESNKPSSDNEIWIDF